MIKKVKSGLTVVVMGFTIVTVLLMWASAYSSHIAPRPVGWYDVLGLAFPVFVVANALAIVAWILLKPRLVIVPILGYLFCISDLRAYCPVNFPSKAPNGCLKLMSYNVANFDGTEGDTPERRMIVDNIRRSDADIVCMQEATYQPGTDSLVHQLSDIYKYSAVVGEDSNITTMRCVSKYPIVRVEQLAFPASNNSSAAFFIQYAKGDTMVIVSNHLESDNLSASELNNYSALVAGREREASKAKVEFLSMLRKVASAAARRCAQVDTVSKFVKAHSDKPLIVCGDFNDTPISYARREISKNLIDAYAATGMGPGFSFNSHGMHVRIDHIMCSHHWEPYEAKVLSDYKGSDHYPITAMFKLKAK